MARQEDQAPPETGAQALPRGREAGPRLAGETRGGFPAQKCWHREKPTEGEGLSEESRDLRGSCPGRKIQ